MRFARMTHASIPATRGADRLFGGLIATACLLAVVMVMHHPVAHVSIHDPAALLADVRVQAGTDRLVHGALAVLFTALTAGMLQFASGLGWRRPATPVAFFVFCLALVFLCLAVMIDGFVTPALAERCGPGDSACAASVIPLLLLGAIQIEVLTRFALFAIAAAILGWSIELVRGGARIAGGLGAAAALAQFALLCAFTGPLRPASLLPVILLQGVWYATVAVLLIGGLGPFVRDPRDTK
jgi:hypothetical protein